MASGLFIGNEGAFVMKKVLFAVGLMALAGSADNILPIQFLPQINRQNG